MDERIAKYWLAISGLSGVKQNILLDEFDSAVNIYKSVNDKKFAAFAGKVYPQVKRFADINYLHSQLLELNARKIKVLTRGEKDYPTSLLRSEVGAPTILYCRGNVKLLNDKCISVAGTTRADKYGRDATVQIVSELASEFVIVTGHGDGIEEYALSAALDSGGSVIIVAACGLEMLKLPKFISDYSEKQVLVISEFAPSTTIARHTYPMRNRIIAALSDALVVIQAQENSRSLSVVGEAVNQSKEIFALPGEINNPRSKGCNKLISDGASILLSADSVFKYFGIRSAENRAEKLKEFAEKDMTDDERAIYNFLDQSGKCNIDIIIETLKMPPHRVFALLTEMENKGIVCKELSNEFILVR